MARVYSTELSSAESFYTSIGLDACRVSLRSLQHAALLDRRFIGMPEAFMEHENGLLVRG